MVLQVGVVWFLLGVGLRPGFLFSGARMLGEAHGGFVSCVPVEIARVWWLAGELVDASVGCDS